MRVAYLLHTVCAWMRCDGDKRRSERRVFSIAAEIMKPSQTAAAADLPAECDSVVACLISDKRFQSTTWVIRSPAAVYIGLNKRKIFDDHRTTLDRFEKPVPVKSWIFDCCLWGNLKRWGWSFRFLGHTFIEFKAVWLMLHFFGTTVDQRSLKLVYEKVLYESPLIRF